MARYREQGWPWLLHAFALFVAGFVVFVSLGDSGTSRALGLVFAGGVVALEAWNLAARRRVEIDDAGIRVGALAITWSDIESFHVREVPIARAGMFLRLTDVARTKLGLPAPTFRERGFGLEPPPTPERDDARYDVFLRARRGQLEEWFMVISVKLLRNAGEHLRHVADQLVAVPRVHADLVIGNLDAMTIAVEAASADDLLLGARQAIANVLPDEARWNPSYTGGVMVLVGPLSLQRDPRAEECLEHVKTAVAACVPGQLRVHAMFAERR